MINFTNVIEKFNKYRIENFKFFENNIIFILKNKIILLIS